MDVELLRSSLDDFIDAWEKFLLDQLTTVELTEALVDHIKVIEILAPESPERNEEAP